MTVASCIKIKVTKVNIKVQEKKNKNAMCIDNVTVMSMVPGGEC